MQTNAADMKELIALAAAGMKVQNINVTGWVVSGDGGVDEVIPAIVVPVGYEVRTFEGFLPRPKRLVQRVKAASVTALLDYVERYGTVNTVVFANPDAPGVVAIIDYHDPEDGAAWASHMVQWDAAKTAEWKEWEGRSGKWFPQAEFAIWLDSRVDDILAIDLPGWEPPADQPGAKPPKTLSPAAVMNLARSLRGRKNQTWTAGEERENGDGVRGFEQRTTAVLKDSQGNEIKPPEYFGVSLRIFEGTEPLAQRVRFLWRISDDTGKLELRVDLPAAQRAFRDAFDAAVKELRDKLADTPVYLGAP